jgi:hypothetical protein
MPENEKRWNEAPDSLLRGAYAAEPYEAIKFTLLPVRVRERMVRSIFIFHNSSYCLLYNFLTKTPFLL